jgi:hypothetical protein
MAVSEAPDDDGERFDHVPVPDECPEIAAEVRNIGSMPREEWNYVFYSPKMGEHIYADTAVDVVMLR